jgi:manganese transport protein
MDPGNWGTDLQAGALYRYGLLWIVALASAMAIVLQLLAARLGIMTGKNLAEACRDWYPPWCRLPLWLLCEIAIGACDLAEVLGSAVAINLLFGVPLFWAVTMTAADVLLLLLLQHHGMRLIERVVLVLILTISASSSSSFSSCPRRIRTFMKSAMRWCIQRWPGRDETLAVGIIAHGHAP